MKIKLNSVIVQDQENALRFYTEILGFRKKSDLPAGEFRWLTVVSPEEPDGVQLVLEPNANAAAATFQNALFTDALVDESLDQSADRDLPGVITQLNNSLYPGVVFQNSRPRLKKFGVMELY